MLMNLKRHYTIRTGHSHQIHVAQGPQIHILEEVFLIFLSLCLVDLQVPAEAGR
jgi:hypothetical protein